MKKYSEQITKIRKMEGLSQEEFAYKLGVSRQMVSKWEIGQSSPRADKIVLICETFGIKPEEFFSDNDKKKGKEETKIDKIIYKNKKEAIKKAQAKTKKRITRVSYAILITIITIYFINSLYKFLYFKSLNKEMLKFKELNNYYLEITTYVGDKTVEKQNIWYLDGKYKIIYSYSNYDENINDQKSIYYIDTETKTRKIYNVTNGKEEYCKDEDISDSNKNIEYKNGGYFYYNFPALLNNDKKSIIKTSLSLSKLKLNKKEDYTQIKIKDKEILINNNRTPMKESNFEKRNKDLLKVKFLNIKLDCTSNDDVTDNN